MSKKKRGGQIYIGPAFCPSSVGRTVTEGKEKKRVLSPAEGGELQYAKKASLLKKESRPCQKGRRKRCSRKKTMWRGSVITRKKNGFTEKRREARCESQGEETAILAEEGPPLRKKIYYLGERPLKKDSPRGRHLCAGKREGRVS